MTIIRKKIVVNFETIELYKPYQKVCKTILNIIPTSRLDTEQAGMLKTHNDANSFRLQCHFEELTIQF